MNRERLIEIATSNDFSDQVTTNPAAQRLSVALRAVIKGEPDAEVRRLLLETLTIESAMYGPLEWANELEYLTVTLPQGATLTKNYRGRWSVPEGAIVKYYQDSYQYRSGAWVCLGD